MLTERFLLLRSVSLLQSPGAGDDVRFMDDASSNPGKILRVNSVYLGIFMRSLVLGLQLLSP